MVLHNGLLKDENSNLSELAADFLPHKQAFTPFPSIIDLALTLPISTARAECCFSVVKKILAPQRLSILKENLILYYWRLIMGSATGRVGGIAPP